MNILASAGPWKMGPDYDHVQWTQSTISIDRKGLLGPTTEQLKLMIQSSGLNAENFSPLKEGHFHFVFKASSPNSSDKYVLKVSSKDRRNSLGGAVYWQGWLEKLISVPRLIFHDLTLKEFPYAFVVFEYVESQDLIACINSLSNSELYNIAAKVIEANKALQVIPPCHGFGGAKSHFDIGMFSSWRNFLLDTIESFDPILRLSPKFSRLPENFVKKLDSLKSNIAQVEPLPFLEDATHRNVMVSEGRFTTLVDLDEVCFGDPLWVIAKTEAESICDNLNLHYSNSLLKHYSSVYNRALYELYLEILVTKKICLAIESNVNLLAMRPELETFLFKS
jgi:hypothetical protein